MGCGWDAHPSDAPEKPGGAAGRRERPAAKATAPSIEGRMFGHMQLLGDGVTRQS